MTEKALEARVLQTVKEMLAAGEYSDKRVWDHPSAENDLEFPKEVLAPYRSLSIFRRESDLHGALKKLQRYIGYDLHRHSAMSKEQADEIENGCDTTSIESVVHAVCRLSEEQLNIIGV